MDTWTSINAICVHKSVAFTDEFGFDIDEFYLSFLVGPIEAWFAKFSPAGPTVLTH